MSIEEHPVSFSLEINVGRAVDDLRKLETVLYRSLGLVRRLSGNEDLTSLVANIQRTLMWINRARLALRALQLARMAVGDPLAWALAGLSVAEVGVDIATEISGR